MMEISGPTQTPPTSSIRELKSTEQLSAIRALQKALEAAKAEAEMPSLKQEGKGQLLDIRC